jgi:hypothetical protein
VVYGTAIDQSTAVNTVYLFSVFIAQLKIFSAIRILGNSLTFDVLLDSGCLASGVVCCLGSGARSVQN